MPDTDQFVNLHRHDQFSLYDGFGTARQAAQWAREHGQPALSLTNHGNANGLVEHYNACHAAGIKPILGCEIYFQPEFRPGKPQFHLTLIARNMTGYQNLMRMLTEANAQSFHRNPVITTDALQTYSDGITLLTGCLGSPTSQAILRHKPTFFAKMMKLFYRTFGAHMWIELQANALDDQRHVNLALLQFARKHGLNGQTVLTSDAHFISPDDYPAYETMFRLNDRKMRTDYRGLHLLTRDQIVKRYLRLMRSDLQHGFDYAVNMTDRTLEIADACSVVLDFGEMTPDLGLAVDSDTALRQMAIKGLQTADRYDETHLQRLNDELQVIGQLGFADYFVMCADMVRFARSKDIGIGFGRGSVCGSLLAYAVGLSLVDPLEHGTLFERFLRPDKTSMPDVDLDFESARRDEVIAYVLQKYEGKAAPISTYGYYRGKNLVNDLAKLYVIPDGDMRHFKKYAQILDQSKTEIKPSHFPKAVHTRLKLYPQVIDDFCRLHGQVRYIGRHAAGVAIAAGDITDYMALQRVRGEMQTAYDLNSLSQIGVLKFDILGLNTIDIIRGTERLIDATPDMSSVIHSKRVYAAFRAGNNSGVFQFERGGGVKITQQIQPRRFEELVACNALNRPGPQQLGMTAQYIEARNGQYDDTTAFWQYTQDTHGVVIYQEQVMSICRGLSRMSWQQIDVLLKEIARKQVTPKTRKRFVKGAMRYSGISKREGIALFDNMTQYLFGKGHATGYSLLSAYAMWLKLHHPVEFWSSVLSHETNRAKKQGYRVDAARDGAVFLIPHVNRSLKKDALLTVDNERVIVDGITSINELGPKAADVIISERNANGLYTSREDFQRRVPKRVINTKRYGILEEYGALEFEDALYEARCIQYNAMLIGRVSSRVKQ